MEIVRRVNASTKRAQRVIHGITRDVTARLHSAMVTSALLALVTVIAVAPMPASAKLALVYCAMWLIIQDVVELRRFAENVPGVWSVSNVWTTRSATSPTPPSVSMVAVSYVTETAMQAAGAIPRHVLRDKMAWSVPAASGMVIVAIRTPANV